MKKQFVNLLLAFLTINIALSLFLYAQTQVILPEQIFLPEVEDKWEDSRYIQPTNSDGQKIGVVTDLTTGLMWKVCSEGQTWDGFSCQGSILQMKGSATLGYTTELNQGLEGENLDYFDWRRPSIEELATLLALDRHYPSINLTAFPNSGQNAYWSKSLYGNRTNSFWISYFGLDRISQLTDYNYGSLRLVRNYLKK